MSNTDTNNQERAFEVFLETKDPEDFGVLVDMTYNRVLSVVDRIVMNSADSRDVVQDSFVLAYSKISTFRRQSAFCTWVTGIAVRKALNLARKRRGHVSVDHITPQADGGNTHPMHQMIRTEQVELMEGAMRSLAPELRAAITLTVVDQLSGAEAAEVCGCLRATLYWRIHRARKVIQDYMEQRTDG